MLVRAVSVSVSVLVELIVYIIYDLSLLVKVIM